MTNEADPLRTRLERCVAKTRQQIAEEKERIGSVVASIATEGQRILADHERLGPEGVRMGRLRSHIEDLVNATEELPRLEKKLREWQSLLELAGR